MGAFKKYDGNIWQPITPKQLKGIPYTGTLPAVLTGTKAGYLHRYKIYGNTEQTGTPTPENPIVPSECGERTVNIFSVLNTMLDAANWEAVAYYGTKYFMYYELPQDYAKLLAAKAFLKTGGEYYSGEVVGFSENKSGNLAANRRVINNDGSLKNFTANFSTASNVYMVIGASTGITDANKQTLINAFFNNYDLTVIEGSTAPTNYIPYGYKLPLLSGSTPVDIYIGDDTLSAEEYVDSSTGKIYRMVSGVLTPTDPPVPFPQIPTSANSTTISWAGSGLAPSEFDSIQEWVDIPTYTYTNGEWVADN